MKATWIRFLVFTAVLALGFSALAQIPGVTANRPYRIGVLLKTLANPFWVTMQEGILAEAAKLGIEVVIGAEASEGEIVAQLNRAEQQVQGGFDGLAWAPITPTNLILAVRQANDRGFPVFNIDERFDPTALQEAGASVVGFATTNNFNVGIQAGEFVVSQLPGGGEVAIIEGLAGNVSGIARRDGFASVINATAGFTLVASQPADWDRVKALDVATNLLQRFPNLKAIYCANDTMALGAAQAVQNAGKLGQVLVVGTDGIDEAVQAVRDGLLAATVAQDPAGIGATSLDLLVQVLNGETIPERVDVPSQLITQETLGQ
ncbi:MAG: D-allose transporter substrate-binding protein [Deinococcus sp.]|nr:D-allose transporter substrate-binding protein [Deinococcus sp.]